MGADRGVVGRRRKSPVFDWDAALGGGVASLVPPCDEVGSECDDGMVRAPTADLSQSHRHKDKHSMGFLYGE